MTKIANSKSGKATQRRASTVRFTWNGIILSVRHQPDYIAKGWDHIELRVVAPKGAILPITKTGYLSHFLKPAELDEGGAAAFFQTWLDREAQSKTWREAEVRSRQGDLFKPAP